MTFCKHGLQSYNIYFVFCNFYNPFLYHFMLVKNVQFEKKFLTSVWIILIRIKVFTRCFRAVLLL